MTDSPNSEYAVRTLMERVAVLEARCAEREETLKSLGSLTEGRELELNRLKLLFDNIPDAIHFKDKEGRYTWVNKAKADSMGLKDRSEAIGKTMFETYSAQFSWEVLAEEQKLMTTQVPIIDKIERITRKDGEVRWHQVTKIALLDSEGQVVGTAGVMRNITERKQMEDELFKASMLLNTFLDQVPDAVYFKDVECRFIRVSRSIHLEGMKNKEEAIGKTDFDYFTEEHARQAYIDEQEIIRTGVPIIDKIEKETYRNKEETWVSTTKVPYYDAEGKVAGIIGISRDVTERFRAQEAIRMAKEELEIRVQERTAALVQEIREHLKMQKALRDSEGMLQDSNVRLETRLSQLKYLNATAHQLSQFTSRKDLLPAILRSFTQCYPGLEMVLCEGSNGELRCTAATPGLDNPVARAACEKALSAGYDSLDARLVVDRRLDPTLAGLNIKGFEHLTVHLALPLVMKNRRIAVAQILAAKEFAEWFPLEQEMIDTLAAQSAISLDNANNFEELEKRARVQSELDVAQRIQRRFTPQDRVSIPRLQVKGVYHPAYEVGGDYLDYFETKSGSWVIVIADVSGKGIPAALVMTMLRSTFRAEARYETSAKKLLCAVNDMMSQDLDEKSFVTALCLIVDKDGRSMTYARVGHPPLVIRRKSVESPETITPKGIGLGMVDAETFTRTIEEVHIDLTEGDRFLIFTDGLTEARDSNKESYGMERVMGQLSGGERLGPEKALNRLLKDVEAFIGNEPYHDDLTILAMEVIG